MVAVRPASQADVASLKGALARAFADDPVTEWTFPGATVVDLARMFEALITKVFLRDFVVQTTDDLAGAALWAPPGTWPLSLRQQLRIAPSVMGMLGKRIVRAARWMKMVDSLHPKEDHWYLSVLGTDPPHQGRGAGSSLMAPIIERCDAEGIPSYLESSKESNVAFYRRHGYEVTRVIEGFGAPPMFAMWREPRR